MRCPNPTTGILVEEAFKIAPCFARRASQLDMCCYQFQSIQTIWVVYNRVRVGKFYMDPVKVFWDVNFMLQYDEVIIIILLYHSHFFVLCFFLCAVQVLSFSLHFLFQKLNMICLTLEDVNICRLNRDYKLDCLIQKSVHFFCFCCHY